MSKFQNRIAVYTAIFGNYDDPKPPPTDPLCDFFLYTDDQSLYAPGYTIIHAKAEYSDPTRCARYFKVNPHLLTELSNYEISVWADASVVWTSPNLSETITTMLGDSTIALSEHYSNDDVYCELERCIKYKKDDPQLMKTQVERYRSEGFPSNSGMAATMAIIRRHQDPLIQKLGSLWWHEISYGSRRDQLSFNYSCWKLNLPYHTFDKLDFSPPIFKTKFFEVQPHRGRRSV